MPLPSLPTLAGLGNPAAIGSRAARTVANQQSAILPQEEEETILQSLYRPVLSGVGWLGETLDKSLGGRAIRGGLNMLAGGDTPLSELASIIPGSDTFGFTDPRNAATGRNVLDNAGITPKNVEGFHPIDNPTDALADVAGFGAEVLLDPATYVGGPLKFLAGGIGAAGKGGAMLGKAGMKDLVKDAARLAGTGTGARRAIMEATGGKTANLIASMTDDAAKARYIDNLDVVKGQHPELAQAMQEVIDPTRFPSVGPRPSVLDEPLYGAMSYGVPGWLGGQGVGKNVVGLGADLSGGFGKYVVDPLDKVNKFLRFGNIPGTKTSLGRAAGQLFDAESKEGLSQPWQEVSGPRIQRGGQMGAADAQGSAQNIDAARQAAHSKVPPQLKPLSDEEFRNLVEVKTPDWSDPRLAPYKNPYDIYHPENKRHLDRYVESGGNTQALDDEWIRQVSRGMADEGASTLKSRTETLSNIEGGTGTIRRIFRDPQLAAMMNRTPEEGRDIEAAARYINDTYGDLLATNDEFGKIAYSKAKGIADIYQKLSPEQIKSGLYGGDTTQDFLRSADRLAAGSVFNEEVANIFNGMAKHANQVPQGTELIKLGKITEALGLDHDRFKKFVLSRQKETPAFPLEEMGIPKDMFKDMQRLRSAVSDPDSPSSPLKVLDTLTNYFKAYSLAPPRRTVRDAASSMSMALITGNASFAGIGRAFRFAFTNYVPEEWKNLPAVKAWLTEQRLPPTPENVRAAISRTIAQYGAVGPQQNYQVGHVTGVADLADTRSVLESVQGLQPADWKQPLRTAFGWNREGWNMLDVSGTMDRKTGELRKHTGNRFVKASEEFANQIEFVNRLVPFIDNLEKGSAFQHAAQVAKALNVDYSAKNFTRFERNAVMRAVPFYKFSRKIIPMMVDQIMERPGGGLAQAFRTYKNSQSGAFVPEHLQGGLAIPIGNNDDGTQRYLTQLGLPLEALNTFHAPARIGDLPNAIKKTGLDLLGMMNPLVKGPLEQATGMQFFSGRDLRDLDPRTGRILKNIGLTDNEKIIPQPVDQLLMNSPASSLLSHLGTATDPRKGLAAKAVNLATGARLSDVDIAKQKELEVRKLIDEKLRGSPGVRAYTDLYVKPEDADKLSERDKALFRVRRSLSAKASSARNDNRPKKPKKPKKPKAIKAKKTRRSKSPLGTRTRRKELT